MTTTKTKPESHPKTYVWTDEHGAIRVGDTRVSLDSVVAGFQRGDAPESIRLNFPALTLEEVYGAITYYLSNKDEVDAYLHRQDELWEKARQKAESIPNPARDRLRTMMRDREAAKNR